MSTAELDATVIEHIEDIDTANRRIEKIEEALFAGLNSTAAAWAAEFGWRGKFSMEKDELWVAPSEWGADGDQHPYFKLWFGPDEERAGTHSWLGLFCGLDDGSAVWRFEPAVKAAVRKRLFADFGPSVRETSQFNFDADSRFYVPIVLGRAELASAVRDGNLGSALGPFRQSLGRLAAAKSAFDPWVAASLKS